LSTNILIMSFHHFEVVEWHLPPAGLIMLDLHISNDLTIEWIYIFPNLSTD
jgi:hypothetical protein